MADLEIINPYPDSYRMDHPDLGDVYKTTYAKGVITEFEQLQDDPITVAPRVKVRIGEAGEESDFIPLFFHPKAQYWDDDEHQTQDFNEEGKYFEKAWMSFRGGDEVIVMLRKGKPFAVVGFADGIPRVGEAMVYFLSENYGSDQEYVICFPKNTDGKVGRIYAEDMDAQVPRGPDGLLLMLTEECEISQPVLKSSTTSEYWASCGGNACWSTGITGHPEVSPWWVAFYGFHRRESTTRDYEVVVTIPVGPIKYRLYLRVRHNIYGWDQFIHVFKWEKDYIEPPPPTPDPIGSNPALCYEYFGQFSPGSASINCPHASVCSPFDFCVFSPKYALPCFFETPTPPDKYDITYDITPTKVTACQFDEDGVGDKGDEVEQEDLLKYLRSPLAGGNFSWPEFVAKVRPHNP